MNSRNRGDVRSILRESEALFLDFDGPVCSVFSGISAQEAAEKLRSEPSLNLDMLSSAAWETEDPFVVLASVAECMDEVTVDRVESALTAIEVEAVQNAALTPGIDTLIRAWSSTGRPLAVVSNNSVSAIKEYLRHMGLISHIDYVSARRGSRVSELKPSPFLVLQAIRAFALQPSRCVLVGDSESDILAARAAGTQAIAYVNKPYKVDTFRDVLTIRDVRELVLAVGRTLEA